MKRIKSLLESPRRLIAVCYAAFLAVSLLCCVVSLSTDRIQRAGGALTEQTIPVTDFELINMEKGEGENVWVTTSDDPRMILADCPEYIRRVDLTIRYINLDPGEFTLFYMPRTGMEEFDANYRLWARQQQNNGWSFSLPAGKTYGLRIDPGIYDGMQMEITSIVLNAKQPALSFFVPSRSWVISFAVFPALIASAVDAIAAAADAAKQRRAAKR